MGSIGKRSEMLNPHVNPNGRFNGLFNRYVCNFARKTYKPLACWHTFDGAGFDYTFNRSMEFDLNATNLRKPDNIFKNLKAGLRIGEAVIPKLPSESWKAGFIARFNTPIKRPEGKVDSSRDILQRLTKGIIQKWMFLFKPLDGVALIIPRKTPFFRFPHCFPLVEKVIIKPATRIKGLIKFCYLAVRREKPVFESFSHNYTLMQTQYNVKNYFKGQMGILVER